MSRVLINTTRTAIFADGHKEKVYETWNEEGFLQGCYYEVLESEVKPTDHREG